MVNDIYVCSGKAGGACTDEYYQTCSAAYNAPPPPPEAEEGPKTYSVGTILAGGEEDVATGR
jgi:hypothetical protein